MTFPNMEKRRGSLEDADLDEVVASPPRRRVWVFRGLALLSVIGIFGTMGPGVGRRCMGAWQAGMPLSTQSQAGLESWQRGFRQPAEMTSGDERADRDLGMGLSVKRDEDTTAATRPVVECFQAAQPVLLPKGATTSDGKVAEGTAPGTPATCPTMLLMEHSFGLSYGKPFIGNYVPPNCDFNRVVMNFTSVSQGRQFDRLAIMYMGDTEVWRTSTAEPTAPPGIRWVYLKDMTQYMYFWKQPQKIIFDLGNLIDDKYTGPFNTTLTATFFKADVPSSQAPPSDLIIPISARKGASSVVSVFTIPQENATNTISFPRNANRAVFSVSANGQANEEFWWSNVLQSDAFTFNATGGEFPAFSPFREVQVYIDDKLAGVQWPFPVVFTGGVVPSLHRPIVGIDVFDLREHEIDITPWLPLLCDGAQHTFTILIAGIDDDGKSTGVLTKQVDSNWPVTGKIFVWLDAEGSITKGTPPTVSGVLPSIRISRRIGTNATGANETLDFTTEVSRSFAVQGTVVTAKGPSPATWSQSLSYSNRGIITDQGSNQINDFTIHGNDASSGAFDYSTEYTYPLYCNTTTSVLPEGNLTLWAHFRQSLDLQVRGSAVFPDGLEAWAARRQFSGGSLLRTTHEGTAHFEQTGDGKNSTGGGVEAQVFRFGGLSGAGSLGVAGPDVELYFRNVSSANNTVMADREVLAGTAAAKPGQGAGAGVGMGMGMGMGLFAQAPTLGAHGTGPRVFMGRGGEDPQTAEDRGGGAGGSGPLGDAGAAYQMPMDG